MWKEIKNYSEYVGFVDETGNSAALWVISSKLLDLLPFHCHRCWTTRCPGGEQFILPSRTHLIHILSPMLFHSVSYLSDYETGIFQMGWKPCTSQWVSYKGSFPQGFVERFQRTHELACKELSCLYLHKLLAEIQGLFPVWVQAQTTRIQGILVNLSLVWIKYIVIPHCDYCRCLDVTFLIINKENCNSY